MLLSCKSSVTGEDIEGMSALTWAVNGRQRGIAKQLLDSGTPVNSYDKLRRTALHHALRCVHWPRKTVVYIQGLTWKVS